MKINLIRYDNAGDGSRVRSRAVEWDTDKSTLDAASPSRYGGGYEFVGVEPEVGGLSITLRFNDVSDLDEFADIAQGAYHGMLTPAQIMRWRRFTDALRELIVSAPRRTMETAEPVQPVLFDVPETISYHAGIDARRDNA